MILEISTHGSYLKRDHDVFVIVNSETKTEIPAEKVESIIITANASISTQAIQLCIEKEIQLVIAEWSGRPIGRFWVSTAGKSTEVRRMQYTNMNSDTGLEISKEIVVLKLKRQRRLLVELKNNRTSSIPHLESAIRSIGDTIAKFSNKTRFDKSTLLGLEGSCALQYFKAVSECLPKKWRFEQRSQNPALDEFNSVLNYTYSLGYSTVEKIIILSGLDPNAGFYHADSYGKPTLSFDLIELSRPSMDRTVISLFTKKKARDDWFEINDVGRKIGVYLSKDARRTIISDFSEKNKKTIERNSWNFCRHIIEKISERTK